MKRISKRLVTTRRHTVGYVVGGKRHTVRQSVQLARRGEIIDVRAVGRHIQSMPGCGRLSDLPYCIV